MTLVSGALKMLFVLIGGVALLVLALSMWGLSEHSAYNRMSPSERLAASQAADAEAAARLRAQAERNLNEHPDGLHCLGAFSRKHGGIIEYVTSQLREPDSFEHISTAISRVDSDGRHQLRMKFRARNGFGGMNVETRLFSVANADCTFWAE